jgi:hypothetical protein
MVTERFISELLYRHDCVIVPDLGGFIANYTPARIHPVMHTFTPPARKLVFNASLRNNDGLLADAIRAGMGLTFSEAVDLISQEVGVIKSRLDKGDHLLLSQIGTLYHDRENNLQFNPYSSVNYHSDSYGLTTFTSPAIKREALHERISRKIMAPRAVRSARRLPATLKWAAVFLPLIGIGLWASFNSDKITTFYHNSASFIPSEWGSTEAPAKPAAKPKPETKLINILPENAPVEASVAHSTEEKTVVEPVKSDVFFVIAGAFGVKENAENLVLDLRSKGYDSFINGQNRRGLYLVSIRGFNDKKLATEKMHEYRAGEFPNAWLLSRE